MQTSDLCRCNFAGVKRSFINAWSLPNRTGKSPSSTSRLAFLYSQSVTLLRTVNPPRCSWHVSPIIGKSSQQNVTLISTANMIDMANGRTFPIAAEGTRLEYRHRARSFDWHASCRFQFTRGEQPPTIGFPRSGQTIRGVTDRAKFRAIIEIHPTKEDRGHVRSRGHRISIVAWISLHCAVEFRHADKNSLLARTTYEFDQRRGSRPTFLVDNTQSFLSDAYPTMGSWNRGPNSWGQLSFRLVLWGVWSRGSGTSGIHTEGYLGFHKKVIWFSFAFLFIFCAIKYFLDSIVYQNSF